LSHVDLRFDAGEWPLTEANRSLDRKIAARQDVRACDITQGAGQCEIT
jgi:hypothetical protein